MSKILIVGLPFFPSKYQYAVDAYHELQCEVKVLINGDPENVGLKNTEKNIFEFAGDGKIMRAIKFFKVMIDFKPNNIDCYNYSVFSLFYVLVSRALGVNVRFWIIGGELIGRQEPNSNSLLMMAYSRVKRMLTWNCLRFSNAIFAKELHHLDAIEKKIPKLLEKTIQIHNCVPTTRFEPEIRSNSKFDFLYANAVIEQRNVISLIKALSRLEKDNIKFHAAIYGFNSISNEVYIPRGLLYSELALKYYRALCSPRNVEVQGFVKNIKKIMEDYRFFVFPSNVILANYALLEAMSYGLVPIIYPGDGYDKLVVDGVNGIVAFDYDLTKAFRRALSLSNDEYLRMSRSAHETIGERFSTGIWLNKLSLFLF